MDSILKDDRFARIATDAKFRAAGNKKKKVAIDKRFESMFQDERFVSRCTVDPRGRPKTFSSKENYRKFYELKGSDESESESESDSESDSESETGDGLSSPLHQTTALREEVETDDGESSEDSDTGLVQHSQPQPQEESQGASEDHESSFEGPEPFIDPDIKAKLHNDAVDYARGEGNLYSDSSSDDSSTDDDVGGDEDGDGNTEGFDKWGELDGDADTTEEATRRLAVCNMDWDRVQAEDIFLVLSSFCPAGGCVKSVHIYLSDFGKSRLEEEERLGPAELRRMAEEREQVEEDYADIIKSGKRAEKAEKAAMERVREYQVNRLKYYYAVAEFDSAQTANSVYTECDGKEYELSATRFDLRFIPDTMDFQEKESSRCTSLPDPAQYKPKAFCTTALQLGKVELTWDEEDSSRQEKLKQAFDKLDDENADFSFAKGLVASSSSSASEHEAEDTLQQQKTKKRKKKKGKKKKTGAESHDSGGKGAGEAGDSASQEEAGDSASEDEAAIAKYRALLLGINQDDDGDGKNMEVSWQDVEPGQDQGSEDEENQQQQQLVNQTEDLTPWEKYLKKKKDKRQKRKAEKAAEAKAGSVSPSEAEEQEEDLPEGIDLNDPYFAEEFKDLKPKKSSKDKKKKKRKLEDAGEDEGEEGGDLALLVMEEQQEDRHFNYKTIVEEETKSKSKKKKWKKKKKDADVKSAQDTTAAAADNFAVNVNDDRFAAIYTRPEFNIDPSEQNFKKTKGMESLIGEKQKRVGGSSAEQQASPATSSSHHHQQQQASHSKAKKSKLDPEMAATLKSVKNKWEKNAKKNKKKKKSSV